MLACVFKEIRALCTRDQSSEGFAHGNRVNSVGSTTPHIPFFYEAGKGVFQPPLQNVNRMSLQTSIYILHVWCSGAE